MVFVSYAVVAVLILTVKKRTETVLGKAGSCRLLTPQSSRIPVHLIFILCFILISVLIIRDMGTMMNAVICAVAILGAEIGCRTKIYTNVAGIYEKGIIAEGRFIGYDEIKAIPSLLWEDRSETSNSMEIVTEQRGSVVVVFSSAEECAAAAAVLMELLPRFGK
jgi:hypothetical protein